MRFTILSMNVHPKPPIAMSERGCNQNATRVAARLVRIMELRIGIVPLPVHLVLLGVLAYFVIRGTSADRNQHDDRNPCRARLYLRRDRPANSACEPDRRRGVFRYIRPLVSGISSPETQHSRHGRHRLHEATNFLYLFIAAVIVAVSSDGSHPADQGISQLFVLWGGLRGDCWSARRSAGAGARWRHELLMIVIR